MWQPMHHFLVTNFHIRKTVKAVKIIWRIIPVTVHHKNNTENEPITEQNEPITEQNEPITEQNPS